MQPQEWTFVDKSKWPERGPWNDEPDKMQWTDEATGLPCLIHRGNSGALCGYVGISEAHPWFQIDYSQPFDKSVSEDDRWDADRPESSVSVHGGLTFSSMCSGQDPDTGRGICHVPGEGEPDHVWWFGFDCAHSGDFCPSYESEFRFGAQYRTVAYVKAECAGLAAQLAARASKV